MSCTASSPEKSSAYGKDITAREMLTKKILAAQKSPPPQTFLTVRPFRLTVVQNEIVSWV